MTKFFTLIILGAIVSSVKAQSQIINEIQPFGKVDTADLKLKSCDFEKDANAEILFDKGKVYFDTDYQMVFERHMRVKIFNDKAKDEGNFRLEYRGGNRGEYVTGIQAETINFVNGKTEITKVDKKLIYTQPVDKYISAVTFSFPNVQPGSIIEYKYTVTSTSLGHFPNWYFQHEIPARYSELDSTVPDILSYKPLVLTYQPFIKNTEEVKAIANIPSVRNEPYMTSQKDNAERILHQLVSVSIPGRLYKDFSNTWTKVGEEFVDDEDFGEQIKRKLSGEEVILGKAKTLKTDDEKIAYIFNQVKTTMKWNDYNSCYTNDGTSYAWNKKTGNATEVNLILNHLLQKAGIKSYPMLVSTHSNGMANPAYPSASQFNRTVAYIPVDSTKFYLLDATNKYNTYNEPPQNLINRFGLCINKDDKKYDLLFLEKQEPVRQIIFVNAEIKPTGKMTGTATLNNFSYNRISAIERYKTDGEKKYIDYLREDDNNLKVSALKLDNMEVDTLPLTQTINFDLDLSESDDNYIYFNSNIFTSLHNNPFLSENRYSNIEFGCRNKYAISGIYKLPAGYKIDALPKNVSMSMADKSITFRRLVAEQDGSIMIRYTIDYLKPVYFKENYEEFHEFFKKLHDMLEEKVVLKKS